MDAPERHTDAAAVRRLALYEDGIHVLQQNDAALRRLVQPHVELRVGDAAHTHSHESRPRVNVSSPCLIRARTDSCRSLGTWLCVPFVGQSEDADGQPELAGERGREAGLAAPWWAVQQVPAAVRDASLLIPSLAREEVFHVAHDAVSDVGVEDDRVQGPAATTATLGDKGGRGGGGTGTPVYSPRRLGHGTEPPVSARAQREDASLWQRPACRAVIRERPQGRHAPLDGQTPRVTHLVRVEGLCVTPCRLEQVWHRMWQQTREPSGSLLHVLAQRAMPTPTRPRPTSNDIGTAAVRGQRDGFKLLRRLLPPCCHALASSACVSMRVGTCGACGTLGP